MEMPGQNIVMPGQNIVVLDIETARSSEDCRHCGLSADHHDFRSGRGCFCRASYHRDDSPCYTKIGWDDKAALGLSIGQLLRGDGLPIQLPRPLLPSHRSHPCQEGC